MRSSRLSTSRPGQRPSGWAPNPPNDFTVLDFQQTLSLHLPCSKGICSPAALLGTARPRQFLDMTGGDL